VRAIILISFQIKKFTTENAEIAEKELKMKTNQEAKRQMKN